MAGLHFDITANNEDLKRKLQESRRAILESADAAEDAGIRIEQAFKRTATGLLAGFGIKEFVSKMYTVRSEFQDAESAMTLFLGSAEKATSFMNELQDYAWYNAFEFSDLVANSKQLLAYGNAADTVISTLDRLSNIAIATKQPLDRLVELYNKAKNLGNVDAVGLKQWASAGLVLTDALEGMNVKVDGSSISFEQLEMVLDKVTNAGGMFHKQMEQMMPNLSMSLGQLQDEITNMFNELGQKSEWMMKSGIEFTSELVANYEKIGKTLVSLIATYGAYKVAIALNSVFIKNWTIAEIAHYNRLLLVEKAQKILNATMLNNPYVLLATLVIGLASAMWAFYDSTTATERAQKRYNDILEKNTETKNKFKSQTEELVSIIQDETATVHQVIAAYKELQKLNPSFKGMTREQIQLMRGDDIKRLINQSLDDKSLELAKGNLDEKIKEAENVRNQLSQVDILNGAQSSIRAYDMLKRKLDELNLDIKNAQNGYQDIIKLQEEAKREAMPKEDRLKILNEELATLEDQKQSLADAHPELQKIISGEHDINEELGKALFSWGKFDNQTANNITGLSNVLKKIAEIKSRIIGINGGGGGKTTFQEDYDAAKKEYLKWSNEVLIIEKNRNKYSTEDYNNAISKRKYAENKYKELGGDTTTKTENTVQKLKEQQEKYKLLLDKQKLEEIRDNEDRQNEIEQKRINLMDDGTAKFIDQMELNFEKEMQAIDRKKEDMLRKKVDDARSVFEADPKNKNKTFDSSSIELSLDEIAYINSLYTTELDRQVNERGKMQKAELASMYDYLKEYGTFEQKKLAITQEYEEKIRKAQNQWEVKSLKAEKNAKLVSVETAAIKAEIDWVSAFSGFGNMFKDVLKDTLERAQKYVQTDKFKNSDHADQQTMIEAINQMKKTLGGGEGLNFKKLGEDVREYQYALRQHVLAEENLKAATDKLTKAQKDHAEAVVKGTAAEQTATLATVEAAQQIYDFAVKAEKEQSDNVTQAQNNVSTTATNLSATLHNVNEGLSKFASGGLKNAYDGFIQIGKEAGGFMGKLANAIDIPIVSEILGIIDLFKDGLSVFFSDLIDSMYNTMANILRDVLSGDVVVTIAQSIRDGIKNTFDAISFGGFGKLTYSISGSNAKETAETISRLTSSNEALKTSIDGLKDAIEGSNGAKAIQAYSDAVEAQKKYEENLRQILDAQMGYSGSHHSNSYYWNLNKGSLDQVNKLLDKTLSNSWRDFSALTADEMNRIRTYLPEVWSEMINEGKYGDRFADDWKAYADQAGELQRLTDQLYENLTQISFDSLRDGFLSMLMDMDSDAHDFADNFSKYMTQALLNSAIGDQLDENMKTWYKSWAETMNAQGGKLTDAQIEEYRSQWNAFVEEGLKTRDEIAALTGYTGGKSTTQSSTKGGFQAMSQDTGDELSGRFTAVQMTLEEIKSFTITVLSDISELRRLGVSNNETLTDLRDIALDSVYYLELIYKNTSQLYFMNEKLDTMNRVLENGLGR